MSRILSFFLLASFAVSGAATVQPRDSKRCEVVHESSIKAGCRFFVDRKICTTRVFGKVDRDPSHVLRERLLTPFHEDTVTHTTNLGYYQVVDTSREFVRTEPVAKAKGRKGRDCGGMGFMESVSGSSSTLCVMRDCMSPDCPVGWDHHANCLSGCEGLDRVPSATHDSIDIVFDCRWTYHKVKDNSKNVARTQFHLREGASRQFRAGDSVFYEASFLKLPKDSSSHP